jgi:hypothetical protein
MYSNIPIHAVINTVDDIVDKNHHIAQAIKKQNKEYIKCHHRTKLH